MSHIFSIYFGLPSGAVWSNVIAEPICVVLAFAAAYLGRHKLGRALAGWWHKHHSEHLQKMLDERDERLKRHVTNEVQRLAPGRGEEGPVP